MLIYLTLHPKCQAIFLVELVATQAERGHLFGGNCRAISAQF